MVRTAVLVSGGGANLQAILDANLFGELKNCNICAVISSVPDAYALKRAEFAKIPTSVVDASIFPNSASFTEAMIKKLKDLDIELVVLAGLAHYLEIQFFREFKGKVIFTHSSLVPSFYGPRYTSMRACREAISFGVKYTGATVFLVTDVPENALIILQKGVEVMKNDTPVTLQRRIMEHAEWDITVNAIRLYCENKLKIINNKIIIDD